MKIKIKFALLSKKKERSHRSVKVKYGKLTVINELPHLTMNTHPNNVECKCSCGVTCLISASSLSYRKSCGCAGGIRQQIRKAAIDIMVDKAMYKSLDVATTRKIQQYKRNARHREIEWKLDVWLARAIINSPCAYCGKIDILLNGIDRISNDVGYVDYNCYPCCKLCNFYKSNKSLDVFINTISNICSYLNLPISHISSIN